MIILSILGAKPFVAAIITILLVLAIYITVGLVMGKKRLSLLDNDCDPEAFLLRTEKQKEITGKNPKINAYLDINRAAALISLGEFEAAKDILLDIDKNRLSHKNNSLLAYTINLISCLYELGEVHHAEELFETQIPILPPVNKSMTLAVNMLIGERFFYLKRYSESREHFTRLWNEKKLSMRYRLEIIYRLAQMDEQEGDEEAAFKKYKRVAEKGNKLWIAAKARERCEEMERR